MRFKLGHPSYPQYDWYINSHTPEVEAEINRMGPAGIITASLDWPANEYPYHGWPNEINSLWWPTGGDQFASLVLTAAQAQIDLVEACVAAQVAAWTDGDPRPYLVLSCLLAPAEGARAAEGYAPAGLDPVAVETELIAWKLYPLTPAALPQPVDGDYDGLWLLPLADARYFWRLTPIDSGGSGSGSGSGGFALIDPDYTTAPPWMPPLRAYPDDSAAPMSYVPIEGNGTNSGVSAGGRKGPAADLQAATECWRIVCRDVRSDYNAIPGGTQHSAFTGILSDYPDSTATVATVTAGEPDGRGSGYAVGDLLTVSGGTGTAAVFRVETLYSAGVGSVGTVSLVSGGAYSALPTSPAATTSGTGIDCTLTLTTEDESAAGSYHQDALRLGGWAGNLIAGGPVDQATALGLEAQKVEVLFDIISDPARYAVVIRKTQADVTDVSHLERDADGLTTAEKDITPRAALGVEANAKGPTGSNLTTMLAGAKQWCLLYYLWRRKQAYLKFPGIAPVIPNGHASLIRWTFSGVECSTVYVAQEQVAEGQGGCCGDGDGGGGAVGPCPVRFLTVTGPLDGTAQRYPAVVRRQERLPAQWPLEEVAWLVGANDEELVEGWTYLARAGDRYSDGLVTWATFCCGSGEGATLTDPDDGGGDLNCCTDDFGLCDTDVFDHDTGLILTITGTGGASCLDGDYAVHYLGFSTGPCKWNTDAIGGLACNQFAQLRIVYENVSPSTACFTLIGDRSVSGCTGKFRTPFSLVGTVVSCDPLLVEFEPYAGWAGCNDGETITFTLSGTYLP